MFLRMETNSLSINILPLVNCLCFRNVFQNGVNTFLKMVNHFLLNNSKFCILSTIQLCSYFFSMWSKYFSNNVWRNDTSNISVSNGNIKCLIILSGFFQFANKTLTFFSATVANATESLESLHTLFCMYSDDLLAIFEPICMVRNVQNFKSFDRKLTFLTPFCKLFL